MGRHGAADGEQPNRGCSGRYHCEDKGPPGDDAMGFEYGYAEKSNADGGLEWK
jgi:hypothetical protein